MAIYKHFAIAAAAVLVVSCADARERELKRTCSGVTVPNELDQSLRSDVGCKGRNGRSTITSRSRAEFIPGDGSCPAGQSQYQLDTTFPSGTVETFRDGSQLIAQIDSLSGCVDMATNSNTFVGTSTIIDGRGRYEGASGTISYSGTTHLGLGSPVAYASPYVASATPRPRNQSRSATND